MGNSGLSLWNRKLLLELFAQGSLTNLTGPALLDFWVTTQLQLLLKSAGRARLRTLAVPAVPTEELASAFSWA